jgi:MPBQ/MSBQ methyltransferase
MTTEFGLPSVPAPLAALNAPRATSREDMCAYYRETADDYRAWSANLNMHFGYWAWGMNPFKREAMLERMSTEVIQRLTLPAAAQVADLGCGAGASARHLACSVPDAQVHAVTCVPEQIAQGQALNAMLADAERMRPTAIQFHCADYTATGLAPGSYDAAYALESDCHCPGPGKPALLAEAARLLKTGGRLVVADAMKHNAKPLPRWINAVYRSMCRNWALTEVAECGALRAQLERSGFTDIEFKEIGWHIAPVAMQIPWFATRFTLAALIKGRGRLAPWRWRHIAASYQSLLVGLWRPGFGYYIVSARKA